MPGTETNNERTKQPVTGHLQSLRSTHCAMMGTKSFVGMTCASLRKSPTPQTADHASAPPPKQLPPLQLHSTLHSCLHRNYTSSTTQLPPCNYNSNSLHTVKLIHDTNTLDL